MKILVYGSTKERAFYKLQNLLDNMRYGDVSKVRKSSFDLAVELKNGDTFQAVTVSDNVRGRKWDYAYIDVLIDVSLINNVIFPSFSYKGNLEDSYEWY